MGDSLLITRFSRDQRHSLVGNVHTNTYSFVTIALDEESFGEGIAAAAGPVETSSIAEHLLVGAAVAFFFPSYGSARGVAGLGIGFFFFFRRVFFFCSFRLCFLSRMRTKRLL